MTEAPITIRGYSSGKISVDPSKIKADYGANYPRLIIPLRYDLNPIKDHTNNPVTFSILGSHCELLIENFKISDSTNKSQAYTVRTSNQWLIMDKEFPLDYNKILRMEECRNENLSLSLNVSLIIALNEQHRIEFESYIINLHFEIEQSYWVKKILSPLQYGEYFLIEIPLGNKIIQDAWSYVDKAETSFLNWDYKGVFGNCREVGSLLNTKIKTGINISSNNEKWNRAYRNFEHYASLFLHVENIRNQKNNSDITITKSDTEYMLIITKTLIKYAGELLK